MHRVLLSSIAETPFEPVGPKRCVVSQTVWTRAILPIPKALRCVFVVALLAAGGVNWSAPALSQDKSAKAMFARVFHSCVGERGGIDFCIQAAEEGHSLAQYFLGERYEKGWGLQQSYLRAALWYRRAAKQGHSQSQLALGVMYAIGRGARQNYVRALTWLTIARAGGERDAPAHLDAVARLMTTDQIAEAERRAGQWKPKIEK